MRVAFFLTVAAAVTGLWALAGAAGPSAGRTARAQKAAPRPQIVQSPIPFPLERKREMKRYARRHYGLRTYLLRRPRVIVEHYTGGQSYRAAFETFARDVPDVELHERPGLCAHFIIDRNGVIHQLVALSLMCRHTVGLNWTAIGIEHVATSDRDVLANRRQLDASLRLTRWLQSRFGIKRRDVIGHAESLGSPYHRERVPALRRQTHADFGRPAMRAYRRRLARGDATTSVRSARRLRLGRSVLGRPIEAFEYGDPQSPRKVLVVGSIHGDETAGVAVAKRVARSAPAKGADLWVVPTLNPDGVAMHQRQNARGVDLNRNFPRRWRRIGRRGSQHFSGPRPLSEPESRIARALITRLRPTVTIWFHQPLALVDRSGGKLSVERRFARVARLPLRRITPYPGTATRWQNHRFPGTTAFVVELPPSPVGARRIDRYARATLDVVR